MRTLRVESWVQREAPSELLLLVGLPLQLEAEVSLLAKLVYVFINVDLHVLAPLLA